MAYFLCGGMWGSSWSFSLSLLGLETLLHSTLLLVVAETWECFVGPRSLAVEPGLSLLGPGCRTGDRGRPFLESGFQRSVGVGRPLPPTEFCKVVMYDPSWSLLCEGA